MNNPQINYIINNADDRQKVQFHLQQAKENAVNSLTTRYHPMIFAEVFADIEHDITIAYAIDLILSLVQNIK